MYYENEKGYIELLKNVLNEGEEINWKTSGMAYEYNKIMFENGICRVGNQPYTLLKSIRNYLFNIQS